MKQVDLEKAGYKAVNCAWTRGYVSRKSTAETREAIPYKGRIDAEYVVLVPSTKSTNYCIKLYYKKGE